MKRYTNAIVRPPAESFANGVTNSNLGTPDIAKALIQHKEYCQALQTCGLKVHILKPDLRFPDSCFVEDTAIITENLAIITKPGTLSRLEETKGISDYLSRIMKTTHITDGNLDGGDIMRVNNHFYIGISDRTNINGATQLFKILDKEGFTSSFITVKNILHLKTGITHLNDSHFVATKEFNHVIENGKIITTIKDENYAANCLFINDIVIIPKEKPNLKSKLKKMKYKIIEVRMSEFQKMDGGLTCLSLIY